MEKVKLAAAKVQLEIEKVRKDVASKKLQVAATNARMANLTNTAQRKLEKFTLLIFL